MYSQIILDYYNNPPNKEKMKKATLSAAEANTSCGDQIEIQLKIDNKKKITEAKFTGTGCIISQASASMLLEYIENKPLKEVKQLTEEKALQLIGIKLTPIRMKCALLAWKTLKKAIA